MSTKTVSAINKIESSVNKPESVQKEEKLDLFNKTENIQKEEKSEVSKKRYNGNFQVKFIDDYIPSELITKYTPNLNTFILTVEERVDFNVLDKLVNFKKIHSSKRDIIVNICDENSKLIETHNYKNCEIINYVSSGYAKKDFVGNSDFGISLKFESVSF